MLQNERLRLLFKPSLLGLCGLLAFGFWFPSAWGSSQFLEGHIEQAVQYEEPGIIGVEFLITPHAYPRVKRVFPNSPAEVAGLRPGDIITNINEIPTWGRTRETIDAAIPDVPGMTVNFSLYRGKKRATVPVLVVALSEVRKSLRSYYPDSVQQARLFPVIQPMEEPLEASPPERNPILDLLFEEL